MIAILVMVLATVSGDAGEAPTLPVAPTATPAPEAAQVPVVPPAPPLPSPAAAPALTLAPPPAVSLDRPAPTRWYGWQLMLSDAAFVTLLSRYNRSGPAVFGSLLGITLGTPLLHIVNGNGRQGMRSMALRSATWLAAAAALVAEVAIAPSPCHSDSCSGSLAADALLPVAILLAGAVFVVVDDTALASVGASPDPGQRVALARARFVPTLAPSAGGATMGLGGVF